MSPPVVLVFALRIAAYLNAAMQSTAAQAAYLATYGTAWAPLGDGTTISDAVTTTMATVR